MITFNGIHNDNGVEKKIRIFLDLESITPYMTDFYIDDKRLDVKIEKNICTICNNDYIYDVKKFPNEIIVAAKEISNLFHCLFPCVCKQKFFVVSNKEEV
jgi:hypothetical protein